jgi:hypothetical protein
MPNEEEEAFLVLESLGHDEALRAAALITTPDGGRIITDTDGRISIANVVERAQRVWWLDGIGMSSSVVSGHTLLEERLQRLEAEIVRLGGNLSSVENVQVVAAVPENEADPAKTVWERLDEDDPV